MTNLAFIIGGILAVAGIFYLLWMFNPGILKIALVFIICIGWVAFLAYKASNQV